MSRTGTVRVVEDDTGSGIRVTVELTPPLDANTTLDDAGPARATALAAAGWVANMLAEAGEDVVSLDDVDDLPEVPLWDDARMVDGVARAIRRVRNVEGIGDPQPWGTATEAARRAYRVEARAALRAVALLLELHRARA